MRDKEYSKWLQSYITNEAIINYVKRCQRVENNLNINLDDEFEKDNGISLLEKLTYTMDDQINNRPLKCNIHFNSDSDLRNGMNSLKTAVNKYFEFCNINDIKYTTPQDNNTVIDSYQEFLSHFNIKKEDFFEWGISATIFSPTSKVSLEWDLLKERILNNKTVYIRGYGRDAHGTQLYKDLYKKIFNNYNVEKDLTNNAEPHKIIQRLTGFRRNSNIYNYQVSHIWGRTKNIFMFEAPWNICYTPKIIDPFTGHETQGIWPDEYQKIFISKAYNLYKPFIDDYNQILVELDIEKRIQEYIFSLNGIIPEKLLTQFTKDVTNELSPICIK